MGEIYHKHHVIPKHMGGTDDPSNLILLTVEEHAAAHDELYKKYGFIEDRLARDGLLGIVNKKEIMMQLNGPVKGRKWYYNPENTSERKMIKGEDLIPEGWLPGRGDNTWAKNRDYKNVSDESRKKRSSSGKRAWAEGKFDNRKIDPEKQRNAIEAMRKGNKGSKRKRVECPHCGTICAVNTYARFHGDNCKKNDK